MAIDSMKVIQEKLPASQVGLEIEVPAETSKQAYEKVVKEYTRSMKIPGFRPGKVPRHVLIQQVGVQRIKAAALEDLIQKGIQQAIDTEKIAAIGNYQLRSSFEELLSQFNPGAALTFLVAVDVQPEVILNQYTGLTIQVEEVNYDPSEIDRTLEERRSGLSTLIPVEDRPAQTGDVAVVDFKGQVFDEAGNPEEISGGDISDFQVELSEDKFIPGFVDGILGMHPDETREVAVKFPEDYFQKDLAGRDALFTITLNELKEKELPDLDDDLAKDISEFETLVELREMLESRLQKDAERRFKANKEQALLRQLQNQVEVDLPISLLDQEVDYLITQTAMNLQNQGVDYKRLLTPETIPELRAAARPEAANRLKRTLALGEIAKRESLQVDPTDLKARVAEVVEQYGDRDVDPARLRSVVEEDLLREKILAWLEERWTIETVPAGSLSSEEESDEELEDALPDAAASAPAILAPSDLDDSPATTPETIPETIPEATQPDADILTTNASESQTEPELIESLQAVADSAGSEEEAE